MSLASRGPSAHRSFLLTGCAILLALSGSHSLGAPSPTVTITISPIPPLPAFGFSYSAIVRGLTPSSWVSFKVADPLCCSLPGSRLADGSGVATISLTTKGPGMYWIEVIQRVNNRDKTLAHLDFEVENTSCPSPEWKNLDTGTLVLSGLGIREPHAVVNYGWPDATGTAVFPECAHFSQVVTLPVFMVDWEDFDPVTDPSNENNPASTTPAYVRSTPSELSSYLNGPGGPAQYFRDASGGQVSLIFDVRGWLRSDTPGSYLRPRADYVYYDTASSPPQFRCKIHEIFLDAVRDAVALLGVDMRHYDHDSNGVLDGAVLVYEGDAGLCNGTNQTSLDRWINDTVSPPEFNLVGVNELVPNSDPNKNLFAAQQLWMLPYVNMPERSGRNPYVPGTVFEILPVWNHELGHMLMGYLDYYQQPTVPYDLSQWTLSAYFTVPSHPAAFEKWLFTRWLEPQSITANGTYQVQADEIPDGTGYTSGPYLVAWNIDGDPLHQLLIENHWFDNAGNVYTRWAPATSRESGLVLFELNRHVGWGTTPPQIQWYGPTVNRSMAFQPGDSFFKCYASQCINITGISAPGARVSFTATIGAQMKVARIGATPAAGDLTCVKGSKASWKGRATVQIVDRTTGLGVSQAIVQGQWSGAVSNGAQGLTDINGLVQFDSSAAAGGSVFTFTVTDVGMANLPPSYFYVSEFNVETSDSSPVCGTL